MKRAYIKILISIIFLQSVWETGKSQELSIRDKEIVQTEAYNLLKDYESITNKIADNIGTDNAEVTKLKDEFIRLFLNRQIQIYNDLEPDHLYSEFYEVETYISNLLLWYPDGMHFTLDYSNIKTPGVKLHKDNIWYLDVLISKKIDGNYMDRSLNNNTEDLSIRIAFVKKGKKFNNFQIVGIRNAHSKTQIADNKALQEVNKADYTKEELINVQEEAKSLLMDYSRSLELIGNPDENPENKKYFTRDFISLFDSANVRVFNDLDIKPDEELIDINEYLDKFKTDYPDGVSNLSLNVDSATYSHIEATDNGQFETFVYINKFFTGNYRDKQKITQSTPLIFTILMDKKEGAFQNLRIKSIDKEYTDFSGINASTEANENLKPVVPITRTGPSIGFVFMGGVTVINNSNLKNLNLIDNNQEWDIKLSLGQLSGIDFLLFKNNKLGLVSGLRFSSYNTKYSLKGQFVSNVQSLDPNAHYYIDSIDADFDSTVNIQYLGVPVGIRYYYDIRKKLAFYVNAGLNFSFLYHAESKLSGYYHNWGHYDFSDTPQHLDIINEKELGFRDDNYDPPVVETPKNLATLNVLAELSIGISIKTGYFSSLQFGPKVNLGLLSVYKPDVYIDIFNNHLETKPTRTNNFGFEISYIRKL